MHKHNNDLRPAPGGPARFPRLAPLLFAALVLAGCATPQAIDPAALPAVPAAFKEADARWTVAAPADTQDRGAWWQLFADPVLDDLARRAAAQNADLQLAAARLAQARALLRSSEANRRPQLGLQAGAARQAEPGARGVAETAINVGATFSYELDLAGRLSASARAATLDAQAREALLQSTRLMVQADVAQAYLALRALDSERRLVRDTAGAYRDTLRLTERRYEAGDVAELDVARVRTELASTEAEAVALDRRRAELEHAIAVLVGEPASGFALADLSASGNLPPSAEPPQVPPGLPSTVLARRPDVAAAQRGLMAAQERVGIARAAWFPSLSLTANGGHASSELSDLFKWSARAWGVGALLSLPVFDGGRREAGVQSAQAELDAALASYRQQVLVAFREVEDQLSGLRLLAQQSQLQQQAVESASRATALSASRYRNGLVSQLELLDAQRSELRNRRQALVVRAAQDQATVGLVRALGGGWEAAPAGSVNPATAPG
ncbi:efflux transporter outer membrane subunit [Eleftheria terrae]|uniref:efflux transporter outer membrane subunit n=1 Tax=Eleftheria terrae TaxID=1597781 RepID=UPI00263A6E94|nr:efflux transporter outer membrane subunit [Eleftheria terrae]WKB54687.1 efflux transporter outer membrane subunit [Eleftheria terrae]